MLGVLHPTDARLRQPLCRNFRPSPFAARISFAKNLCQGAVLWLLLIVTFTASLPAATDPSIEALKSRLSSASVGDKPHLCVQIAEHQLAAADRFYTADNVEEAQATMTDVVTFSELARDYAIQSHKYQKQTEIAVRNMARKLADLKHLVSHDDQAPIQAAINRLQRVRDDLLMAMFPKGHK